MGAVMTGGEAFREAMEVAIPPRTEAFAPDVVVISVHFDGHNRVSLGNLNLVSQPISTCCSPISPEFPSASIGRFVESLISEAGPRRSERAAPLAPSPLSRRKMLR